MLSKSWIPENKQEDYYLDEYDRSGSINLTPEKGKHQTVLNLGAWGSTELGEMDSPSKPREIYASIELSREDLIEAKKDRLFFGLLKNKLVGLDKNQYDILIFRR